jgi:hypothetical protein
VYSWPVPQGGKPRPLLAASAATAAYLLTRVPLLGLGFGTDADVWSVAANGRLLLSGHYVPSRFPGHPLHEVLFAGPMVAGGPLASNAINLALSVAALALTWRLARGWAVPAPHATVALLAAHPLFWIASADSTDFMLATVLALGALEAARAARPLAAGALLGLAAGARVECLAFALPVAWLLPHARLRMAGAAAGVAALLFLPVCAFYLQRSAPVDDLVTAGLGPGPRVTLWLVAMWAALGLVPGATLAALLARARGRVAETLRARDPLAVAGLLLAAAYALLTLAHPSKASYFVPALPLLLLTLSRWVEPRGRLLLAAAFVSYALIYPDLVDRDPQGVRATLRANNGLVAKDVVARVNAAHVFAQVERGRPPAGVVVLGYWLDAWRWGEPAAVRVAAVGGVPLDPVRNAAWRAPDGTVLVHTLSATEAPALRARGLPLAYGEGIDAYAREVRGVDLAALGATAVPVRVLGREAAERFTAPHMIACLAAAGPWVECLRARTGTP